MTLPRSLLSTAFVSCLFALVPGGALGAPSASSEKEDHPAAHAFDGLMQTGWSDDEEGDGSGTWLQIALDTPTKVESVSIWPGNLSGSTRTIREYGRPADVTVRLQREGGAEVSETWHVLDPGEEGEPLRVDIDIVGVAETVRIEIDKAYPGGIHADLFIAEVAVNFAKGPVPPKVTELRTHLHTDAGKEEVAANHAEVVGLFERCTADDIGDRDAFLELTDRAADGAPFLREQVLTKVPAGYRVQSLPPDASAVEALLKIKDANAIPAIERAGLRLTGSDARRMAAIAEKFRAYQDLVGGGSRNIPPYGQLGWEEGALQGFGEPVALAVDRYGNLYAADVANHRVQRYNDVGVVDGTWCNSEPGVTDVWFNKRRDFYVTGCMPSEAEGGFVNPVSIALFPGKDADTIAVLDASARVTLIGEDGKVARVLKLPTQDPIVAGVGGEGHVFNVKDKLVVVWANEGWVYDLEGEEKGSFKLLDGAPSGGAAKGSKLALIYDQKLVLYSLDGFRHGDLVQGSMGKGFEFWDVTLDDKGKLWAVTDKGNVWKLSNPSNPSWSVSISEISLENPRIAVLDGVVFVSDRGKVTKADALELHAQAELERKQAKKLQATE